MTELLEKAIAEITKLSEAEQNTLATWILAELESERQWTKVFTESADILAQLADEAREEHQAGKTKILDLDSLE